MMNYFVVFVAIVLQVSITSANSPNQYDIQPKGVVTLDGRRYYFSSTKVTAPQGLSLCQELNMTLAGLETVDEYNTIFNYINNTQGWGETGLYYTSGVRHADTWIWSNVGRPFSYFSWSTELTEPDITDSTTQQCLFLADSGMGDLACNVDHNFICEQQGL